MECLRKPPNNWPARKDFEFEFKLPVDGSLPVGRCLCFTDRSKEGWGLRSRLHKPRISTIAQSMPSSHSSWPIARRSR